MWGLVSVGVLTVLAAIFSLAKSASRAERMAESHREELLARKNESEEAAEDPD